MLRKASALATIASVVLFIAAFTLYSDRVGLAQESSGGSMSVGPASVSPTTRPATRKDAAGATSLPSVSFLSAVTYTAGAGNGFVGSLVVSDVNGDGKPDLVVVNVGEAVSVGVLLGNGDGTFQRPILNTSLSQVGEFNALAVVDVNADGKPDLIIDTCCASNGDDQAAVLLGNGDGTFQAPVRYDLGGSMSVIAAADMNGDGKADIISANYNSNTVTALLGNGDGTFQSPISTPGPFDASCLVVADVNGDGRPDALVCSDTYMVTVLLGNGDGTFQSFTNTNFYTGFCTNIPAIADLNGDGAVDMVAPNAGTDDCSIKGSAGVLLGTGTDALFQPEVDYAATTTRTGGVVGDAVVADVNLDGKPDIIVASGFANIGYASSSVGVLLGKGNGKFQQGVQLSTASTGAIVIAAADLNGDGKPDIVTAGDVAQEVSVLINIEVSSGASTATTLVSSLNPSIAGQSITFTAGVTSNSGTPPNGETVTFHNGLTALGSGVLSGGTASLATSSLSAGTHSITASYAGDSNFLFSTSAPLRQVVNPTTKSATATTISSSLNPSIYGQKVTWTATVTTSGPVPPTGKVNFVWSGYNIGTATLNSSSVATLTRSNLNVGTLPLTAIYVGDANNLGSTSSVVNQVITQATSAATLTSSPNPSSSGEVVTFTATITSPTFIPTGPVTFTAGKTVLGTANLSGGKAKFTTSTLAVGKTTVKATYAGSSDVAESSATVKQTVQ